MCSQDGSCQNMCQWGVAVKELKATLSSVSVGYNAVACVVALTGY